MQHNSSVHYSCRELLEGLSQKTVGVFTGAHWFQCTDHRPTWGLLHLHTPLVSSWWLCATKLFSAISHSSFLTLLLRVAEYLGMQINRGLHCYRPDFPVASIRESCWAWSRNGQRRTSISKSRVQELPENFKIFTLGS